MRLYKSYVWKFILGTEIIYFLCLFYGSFLSDSAFELHRSLFSVAVPGFVWGSGLSIIVGAIFWGVIGAVVGWYLNWMHNSSLK